MTAKPKAVRRCEAESQIQADYASCLFDTRLPAGRLLSVSTRVCPVMRSIALQEHEESASRLFAFVIFHLRLSFKL